MKTITEKWFGDHFTELHPKLQKLHSEGGELNGEVRVEYGTGVAGLLGKRLGKKLGLPQQTESTSLRVVISHTDQEMNWSRQFGSASKPMVSVFKPVGNWAGLLFRHQRVLSLWHTGRLMPHRVLQLLTAVAMVLMRRQWALKDQRTGLMVARSGLMEPTGR